MESKQSIYSNCNNDFNFESVISNNEYKDIWINIIMHLNLRDCCNLSVVCKYFYDTVKNEVIWKFIFCDKMMIKTNTVLPMCISKEYIYRNTNNKDEYNIYISNSWKQTYIKWYLLSKILGNEMHVLYMEIPKWKQSPFDITRLVFMMSQDPVDFSVRMCVFCKKKISCICTSCEEYLDWDCHKCSTPSSYDSCDLIVGKCNHVFHRHCMERWFRYRYSCPLDNSVWDEKLHQLAPEKYQYINEPKFTTKKRPAPEIDLSENKVRNTSQ